MLDEHDRIDKLRAVKLVLIDLPDMFVTFTFAVWCANLQIGAGTYVFAVLAAIFGFPGCVLNACGIFQNPDGFVSVGGPALALVSDLMSCTAMFIEGLAEGKLPAWMQVMNYLFSISGLIGQSIDLVTSCRGSSAVSPF